jgi:hypothetical protein
MHTGVLKLIYTYNELLHVSANHVALTKSDTLKVKHTVIQNIEIFHNQYNGVIHVSQ